jgi:hypothetical protein
VVLRAGGVRINTVFFELRDAVALPRPPGSVTGADLGKTSRRSNYVACITVSRTSAQDVGFREIFLSVDGKEVAILSHGETVTHELPAGPHRIRAHNTLFWKTHDVVLQPGEHARFTAINRAGWGTFGFLMILGAAPLYLTFERERDG